MTILINPTFAHSWSIQQSPPFNGSTLMALVLAIILPGIALGQGASSSSPSAPLTVREIEPLPGWVSELQSLDAKIGQHLQEYTADPPTLSSVALLNEVSTGIVKMSRLARRLSDAREAAGQDYLARAERAQKHLRKIAEAIKQDPEFPRVQARIRKDFVSETKAREKKLGRVKSLIKQGDWERADDTLGELTDELPAASLWLDATLIQQALELFEPDRREIARGASKSLQERLLREMRDTMLLQPPDVEALVQRIERAVKEYQQSTEVSYRGMSLRGPGLVRRFYDDWREAQLQVTRHAAMCSYIQQPRSVASEQALEALADRLPMLIEDLARTDASRGSERTGILALYAEYLQSLAPVSARQFDPARTAVLQNSLSPLANHAAIREDVQGYRVATDAILAWRRRVAEAQCVSMSAQSETVDQLLQKVWQSIRGGDEAFRWKDTPGEAGDPLDQLIQFVTQGTVSKSVRLSSLDASRSESRMGTNIARGAAYAMVAIPKISPPLIAAIRRELLIDEQHPPLTLRAAAALWALENACVEEVGGQITEVSCEAVAPTWLNLSESNNAYLPSGTLLTRDFRHLEKSVCLKISIQPAWLRYGPLLIRLR